MHVYWNNTRTHILNTSSVNLIEFHQNNYYCTSIYYYRYYISVLRYVQYNCIKIYYWCTYIINCKQVNVYKTLLLEWSFRHVSIPQSQIYFEVMKNSSGWHLIPHPPTHTYTHQSRWQSIKSYIFNENLKGFINSLFVHDIFAANKTSNWC